MDEDAPVGGPGADPYQHDPTLVPALAVLVDRACDGVEHILDISARVRTLAPDAPDVTPTAVRQLALLFSYVLSVKAIGSPRPGAYLDPFEGPSMIPPALRDVDSETHALWISLADSVAHPIALARCNDVVFTLQLGSNNRDVAERAIRAYLNAVGGSLLPREQAVGLLRAWTLARTVGLAVLEAQVVDVALDMATAVIGNAEAPYALLPLLDAATAPPRKKGTTPADPRAIALTDQALSTYTNSHIVSEFATLVRARFAADVARVDRANRLEISARLDEADAAVDGLVIRSHLNEAASLARKLKVSDLEQLAISRLQTAPPVEWATITGPELRLPPLFVQAFLGPFQDAPTWREALAAWCATGSPSGRYENNRAVARQASKQSVIRWLATNIRFGRDGLPKRVIAGDDQAFEEELVQTESMAMAVHALLLGRALDLIAARFGVPSRAEVTTFFMGSGTHPELAKALATSLQLFWVREYTACVHLVVPKIESTARALLLELNEPIYRTAVGDSDGQFAGLGSLLPYLADNDFDPDWERFLRTFLLSDGSNVRNLVAHGFMDDVDRDTAALSLRACALMVLITNSDAAGRDRAEVRLALSTPVTSTLYRSRQLRCINALRAAYLEMRR